jgi:hypothetical protein
MKVRELIEALGKLPPDATVVLDRGALEFDTNAFHCECSVVATFGPRGRRVVLGPWTPNYVWLDAYACARGVTDAAALREYRQTATAAIPPRLRGNGVGS